MLARIMAVCFLLLVSCSALVAPQEPDIPDIEQFTGKIVYTNNGNLYTQNLDTTGKRRIHINGITDNINPPEHRTPVNDTTIMNFGTMCWSPDGTKIAIGVNVNYDQSQLIVMDADGGNARAASPNTQMTSYPDWSPDGTKIVYSMSTSIWGASKEIFITDLQTDTWKQLTNYLSHQVGSLTSPRWSAEGDYIYFFGGGWNIPRMVYRYEISSERLEVVGVLPDFGQKSFGSTITRDGKYVFGVDSTEKIVRYDIEAKKTKIITTGPNDGWPYLSYGDNWLIFTRGRHPVSDPKVYLVTPEGNGLQKLSSFEHLIYASYEMDIYWY